MSIYQEPRADILGWVNKKGGTTFTLADVIFSAPKANAQGSPKNTKVRLTIVKNHATFKGSFVFDYNRLDLAGMANIPTPSYPPFGSIGNSVYTLLQKIRNSYGVYLSPEDLEETFITDDGANGQVLLKAKSTSHGWTGQWVLTLVAKPSISTLFTNNAINWS